MEVKITNVRLAFAELFTAKTVNGEGEPRFSCAFLFPPNHPAVATINAAIDATAKEKWGAKAPQILAGLRQQDRTCLHNGNNKPEYEGYPGNLFVNAANKSRPLVTDADKGILTAQDGRPYGGCYVHAKLELWAQDNKYGKRVNASLMEVRFHKDGDAFSGGRVPTDPDEYEDLSEGASSSSLV